MRTSSILLAFAVAVGVAVTAVDEAAAQGMQDRMGPGMMQGSTDQQTMGQGMMPGGMGPAATGQGMGQCMMHSGMGSGMMGQNMGRGMMQGGSRSGMGALFGSRVTPIMNLSPEDVRGYLGLQLQRLNNKRLKIGDLKSDDGTITADIVTVDNSLVQRLKIDRHTGAIQYEN
jgi:hypothetical protein